MLRTALAAAVPFATLACCGAADLRIETRVYSVAEKAVVGESLTCFRDGVVYDFRDSQERVTIYRGAVPGRPARFVLLDTQGERQTTIEASQVAAATNKLKRWATSQQDPFLRFTGNPTFAESYDEDTGELRLESELMTYRLVTLPLKKPAMKLELRQFLDGFARLQTLLEAGLPPEPRLRVNEALFRHGVGALEVELISRSDEPALRASHDWSWVLSKQDLLRIDVAADQLVSFQKVSNAEFQQARLRTVQAPSDAAGRQ